MLCHSGHLPGCITMLFYEHNTQEANWHSVSVFIDWYDNAWSRLIFLWFQPEGFFSEDIIQARRNESHMGVPICCCRHQHLVHVDSVAWTEFRLVKRKHNALLSCEMLEKFRFQLMTLLQSKGICFWFFFWAIGSCRTYWNKVCDNRSILNKVPNTDWISIYQSVFTDLIKDWYSTI